MSTQRQTKQKTLIKSLLLQAEHPLLPNEILSRAQESIPNLGIATVFRALRIMVDEGEAKIVNLAGDSPRYEHAHLGHHHHFKCNECDSVFEVLGCPGNLENLLPKGFQLTDHEITLFGHCATCSGTS